MPEMVITFRVPRWRTRVALGVGFVLELCGALTDARLDGLTSWLARGVKVER